MTWSHLSWLFPLSKLENSWEENVAWQLSTDISCLVCENHSVVPDSSWPHGLHSPWNSAVQNSGVGSLFLLQGIFPTEGLNPGLPHCRPILHQLSHKGSPRILEWVAYPFSRGSSRPRNQTLVSCIAGRFFTNCTMKEASFVRGM